VSGALPAGVTFLGESGLLSGTPQPGTGGTYALTFTATNSVLPDATQAFALTVNEAPAFTSATSTAFTAGSPGSFSVTANGFPAPTLALDTGTLPTGVTFDPATGLLAGTPDAGSGGIYTLLFSAKNGIGTAATQSFTLTVGDSPVITSAASTTFIAGTASSFSVTATGFPVPTLALTSGTLPGGVTFDPATGALAGAPAAESGGTYALQFTASNGILPDSTQDFTLTVSEAPVITSADSATFTVGSAGSFTVTAIGFPTPTLSVSGALPGGVSLSPAGLLSGTPTESGTFALTFTATNGISPDAVQEFTLTVEGIDQDPLILTVTPGSGSVGDTLTLSVSGGSGTGAVSYSVGGSTACSVSGDQLLLTSGDGLCEVTATKAGDSTYNEATSNTVSVAIGKLDSGLSVESASGQSGGTTTLSATLTSGGTGVSGATVAFSINGNGVGSATTNGSGVATLTDVSLAGIAEGSYPGGIGGSFAGNGSYLPSSATGNLTVDAAPITLPDQQVTVTGDPRFPISGSAAIPGVEGVTYALNSAANNGSVVVSPNGSFTYTAASTLVTSDTFTVLATAPNGETALVTINIILEIDPTVPTYGSVKPGSGGGSNGGGGNAGDARSPSSDDNDDDDDVAPTPTPGGGRVQQ
jgi:hypothetical protein